MEDISVKTYSPEYKDSLLSLLSYHWTDLTPEEMRERFKWRYEDNPYTKSPYCYLALDGEKVVGHCGSVVQKFRSDEEEYYFCTPADAVVHPDYRRKGVFSSVLEFSRDHLALNSDMSLILILSATEASTAVSLIYDDVPVSKREYYYAFSFFNILRSKNFQTPISMDKNGLKIEITKELRAEEICRLMDDCREKDKIANVRDEKFYEWRFSNPLEDYIFVYCTKEGELVGYVALANNDEKIVPMMEYGYLEPSYLEDLIEEIFKNLSISCLSAYIFTRSDKEKEMLSRIGFRDRNDWLIKLLKKMNVMSESKQPGALVKPLCENITEEDFFLNGKDIREPNNWSLFLSDMH